MYVCMYRCGVGLRVNRLWFRDPMILHTLSEICSSFQSEDILRQTQQLTHLIEQSENVILINLDR